MSHHILVIDDDFSIQMVLRETLEQENWRVSTCGSLLEARDFFDRSHQDAIAIDLIVSDVLLPDGNLFDSPLVDFPQNIPALIMSAQNTLETAMRAREKGAFDYLAKPFDIDELVDLIRGALPADDGPRGAGNRSQDRMTGEEGPLIGRSEAMQRLYRDMARIAQSELSVLITGESGSGKELVARALHSYGTRKDKPFVSVNMAAIPHDLVEAELFGHVKGAFTGAVDNRQGRFAEARGGTLFLDEIGDMPLEAQTRLLRVLQEGEYRPVGSNRIEQADVRVISATHRKVSEMVTDGSFREDLFFRLNVVPLYVPSLRERLDDLDALVRYFLQQNDKQAWTIEADAIDRLQKHGWPGNVRELKNLIARLSLLGQGRLTGALVTEGLSRSEASVNDAKAYQSLSSAIKDHLDMYFDQHDGELPPAGLHGRLVRELEKPLIEKTLRATGGNQVEAAHVLGINRNTLRQRIKDLGIEVARARLAENS